MAGLVVSAMVTRLMASLLFGVSPMDPPTYAIVILVVLAVVTSAAYIPASRATRRGCVEALRAE